MKEVLVTRKVLATTWLSKDVTNSSAATQIGEEMKEIVQRPSG
jgi:hypothetical protein